MLFWRLDDICTTPLQHLAHKLQLNIFAVSKTSETDLLISWPRIVKQFCPEPPNPDFPDPVLFAQMRSIGQVKSAIYMDVDNMFHNHGLSIQMADLFPPPFIFLSQLPARLQEQLRTQLNLTLNCNPAHRPLHTTTPMGFRWSVCHYAASALIFKSIRILSMHTDAPELCTTPNCQYKFQAPLNLAVD